MDAQPSSFRYIPQFQSNDQEGVDIVKTAIDVGYRHIDTAFCYNNEAAVGRGIQEKLADGTVTRDELFVVTKLANTHHAPEDVERAIRMSLKNLGLDYVDLFLMHTPMGWKFIGDGPEDGNPTDADGNLIYSDVDYVDTWRAMEDLVEKGLTRSIGVSNFNSLQLTRILDGCRIKPVTNQVECGPTINQEKLRQFCQGHGIPLTAYTPLGRMKRVAGDEAEAAVNDPRVIEIARRYQKTPAQVVLRFLTQLGTIPIPKSSNRERMLQNISIFDFELTADELKVLEGFSTGQRHIPFPLGVSHPHYPFSADF